MSELLTIKELCEAVKVDRSTIWRWRIEGLPYEAWGPRSIRFDLVKVREWVKARGENEQRGVLDKAKD